MLIFIDESGIHKKVDHSTFALSYIKFNNYEAVEKKMIQLEKKLGIEYFHWSKTAWNVKEKYMDQMLNLDFQAKIAVIKNPIDPAKELENILLHTIVERNIKNIYIDGKKPKWFEKRIKKVLRDKGISVRKLRTVKSKNCAGARLADMVAGLSRSYFDKKNLDKISKYYKRLEDKLIIVLE